MLQSLISNFHKIKTECSLLLKFLFTTWWQMLLSFTIFFILWGNLHYSKVFDPELSILMNVVLSIAVSFIIANWFAIPIALFLTSWKVMRGWTLFFILLWLLVFIGVFYFLGSSLIDQGSETLHALGQSALKHEWAVGAFNGFPAIFPPLLIILAPFLIWDLIHVLSNPSFLLSLLILLIKFAAISFVATAPVILLYMMFFIKKVLKKAIQS